MCCQSVYHLIAVAADSTEPLALTSTARVIIYVIDINDNAPVFIKPSSQQQHSMTSCINDVTVANDTRDAIILPTVFVHFSAVVGSTITRVSRMESVLRRDLINYRRQIIRTQYFFYTVDIQTPFID